ncbi:hypothetical protein B0E51_14745 [Rhodanobacter sp. C05]|nr:hypothetical protein B0E51_14745 [Rhodanobacter sp. C05]
MRVVLWWISRNALQLFEGWKHVRSARMPDEQLRKSGITTVRRFRIFMRFGAGVVVLDWARTDTDTCVDA